MTVPTSPAVHLDFEHGVATLTLDDAPRRNAMSMALGDALYARVDALRHHPDLRAVVLTGAGGAFSGGGDLGMLDALRRASFDDAREHMLTFYTRYLAVSALPVPVIAAVRGAAIGAGLCVALSCDITLVDADAKLAVNFAQLGLAPGMGVTVLLERRVGAQRAAELLYTGRRFDGRAAVEMGLALSAHPADAVLSEAQALARTIASNGPLAVRALKSRLALDHGLLMRALEAEATAQAHSYASDDLGEGLAAAMERRPARFTGR